MLRRKTPLARTGSLKRSAMKRRKRKTRPGDDKAHLQWVRTLPCCLIGHGCEGRVQAHHLTIGRGLSQKSADADAIPLCDRHHKSLHRYTGFFKDFSREQRADWQRAMSAVIRGYQDLLAIKIDVTEGTTP